MKTKLLPKWWISISVTVGLLALLGVTGAAVAQKPGPESVSVLSPAGGSPVETMTYQGRLVVGGVPANGVYDFRVGVWNSDVGGNLLGSTQVYDTPGITVQDGVFVIYFTPGSPNQVFTGGGRWLQLEVRPHGVGGYTTLPRQPITNVPYAWSLKPKAVISGTASGEFGNSILNLYNDDTVTTGSAIHAKSASGYAVHGEDPGGIAIYGYSVNGYAVYGVSNSSTAGYFHSGGGYGIEVETYGPHIYDHAGYFKSNMGYGVYAKSTGNMAIRGEAGDISSLSQPMGPVGVAGIGDRGVWGSGDYMGVYGTSNSASGYGGYFTNYSTDGVALYAYGTGTGRDKAALRVDNFETSGGMAAYLINDSDYHTAHLYNASTGGVLYLQNGGTDNNGTGGGDFITAVNETPGVDDPQFRVLTSGEVRSDVGFNTPAADFAEMLPAAEELEPGDVLVIGPDSKLHRSTEPYQGSVLGVYSTKPGFVGGQPVDGDLPDRVPLAVVGVVPVKVSAENGPIRPGDLLTTSSTPSHAMKAGPNPSVGTVIGKALGTLAEGKGVIQMLVTLQ